MADSQSFSNVDAAKWERIKGQIKEKVGVTITTDSGRSSAKGITISWAYSPSSTVLVVILEKRSFYDPSEQTIDKAIADLVANA